MSTPPIHTLLQCSSSYTYDIYMGESKHCTKKYDASDTRRTPFHKNPSSTGNSNVPHPNCSDLYPDSVSSIPTDKTQSQENCERLYCVNDTYITQKTTYNPIFYDHINSTGYTPDGTSCPNTYSLENGNCFVFPSTVHVPVPIHVPVHVHISSPTASPTPSPTPSLPPSPTPSLATSPASSPTHEAVPVAVPTTVHFPVPVPVPVPVPTFKSKSSCLIG